MSCLPGMPCYDNVVIVHTTYPPGCAPSVNVDSNNVIYTGPNLPFSGILHNDCLTDALQKIDNKLDPTDLVTKMIAELTVNPALRALFCDLVNNCNIPANNFISVWNTEYVTEGSSSNSQIKLPLSSSGTYNFVVDWGDGNTDAITAWDQTETLHNYASGGTYTITINGNIQGWRFNASGDRNKILSITRWGCLNLGNDGYNFWNCDNLDLSSVSDILDLTGTTNLEWSFSNCGALTIINNLESWNVSNVLNMNSMFFFTAFNQDISSWDVSSATNLGNMFSATPFNQNISSWDVSSVQNFSSMFANNSAFNQNIASWNVSSATNMNSMFGGALAFNQDLSSWCVTLIPSLPTDFYAFVTGWILPKPIWGTCP